MKKISYNREELVELNDRYGSIGKVASELNRSFATVRAWYSKFDIPVQPSCMSIYQELREIPMTEVHKSVILGSILGDGSLKLAPHSKNARLSIAHSVKQIEYLRWKHDILNPFSRDVKFDQKAKDKWYNGCKFRSKDTYRFYTIVHPDITKFYKQYYVNGVKHVVRDVIEELDWLALSIWFGDDGSSYIDKRNGAISCTFCTNSFEYKDQLILIEALRKFFDGTIKISKQGNIGREDLILRLYQTEKLIPFMNKIKNILPKSLYYKTDPQRLDVELLKRG